MTTETVSPYDYAFDLPKSELRSVLAALVDRHSLATVLASLEQVRNAKAGAHPDGRWHRPASAMRNAEQVARRCRL